MFFGQVKLAMKNLIREWGSTFDKLTESFATCNYIVLIEKFHIPTTLRRGKMLRGVVENKHRFDSEYSEI